LQKGEGRAAGFFGHQLGKVGINRDELEANPERADEAPDIDPVRSVLHSHDKVGDAKPQQGVGEDCTPTEMVCDI
jgi:hypothetical protein